MKGREVSRKEEVPDDWKKAIIVPLYKGKGSRRERIEGTGRELEGGGEGQERKKGERRENWPLMKG